MGLRKFTATPMSALALGFSLTPMVFVAIGNLSFMSAAMGEPAALTNKQSNALNAYNNAVSGFEAILGERRAQITSNQRLRTCRDRHSTCTQQHDQRIQDLTDTNPSKIGRAKNSESSGVPRRRQ